MFHIDMFSNKQGKDLYRVKLVLTRKNTAHTILFFNVIPIEAQLVLHAGNIPPVKGLKCEA